MKLRDYQEAAAEGVLREWQDHVSALVVLPTGLGKTVLFADVIRRMNERGVRAMVLAQGFTIGEANELIPPAGGAATEIPSAKPCATIRHVLWLPRSSAR